MSSKDTAEHQLSPQELNKIAKVFHGANSYDELGTDEKRSCAGHGGQAHRLKMSVDEYCATHGPGSAEGTK